jgi:SOS-response transcriptional repressor LexA
MAEVLPHDECLVMRMPDDSMRPFLRPSDGLVVDPRARSPRSLAVVVLRTEGTTLVRRFKSAGSTRILAGANPCVPPVELDDRVEIVGTLVGLVARDLRDRLAFELAPPWP